MRQVLQAGGHALRRPQRNSFFDVVHHAVKLPLRVDLLPAAKVEPSLSLFVLAQYRGANVKVTDTTAQHGCLGVWGPNARTVLQKISDEPEAWTQENIPFAALRNLKIKGARRLIGKMPVESATVPVTQRPSLRPV